MAKRQLKREDWRKDRLYLVLRQQFLDGDFSDAFAFSDYLRDRAAQDSEAEAAMKVRSLARLPVVPARGLPDPTIEINVAFFQALSDPPSGIVPPERGEMWSDWLIRIGGVPVTPFPCDWAAVVGYNPYSRCLVRASHKKKDAWETFQKLYSLGVLIPHREWLEVKRAWTSVAMGEFMRMKMREDGFFRRIMPLVTITSDELDRSVATDGPFKVVDEEPARMP